MQESQILKALAHIEESFICHFATSIARIAIIKIKVENEMFQRGEIIERFAQSEDSSICDFMASIQPISYLV